MEKNNSSFQNDNIKESSPLESPDKYDSAESQTSDLENSTNEISNKVVVKENEVLKKEINENGVIKNDFKISSHDNKNDKKNENNKNKINNINESNITNGAKIYSENSIKNTLDKNELKKEKLENKKCLSDNEVLVDKIKKRISQKFDLLEKQTGIKLEKSDLNFNDELISNNKTKNNIMISNDNEKLDAIDSKLKNSDYAYEIQSENFSADLVKDQNALRLEYKLKNVQNELKLKDEEIAKLSKIRAQVEIELEDLTASLFEEANKMVREAKTSRSKTEKLLKEVTMRNDVLQAEVKALKLLVLNSTPSSNTKQINLKNKSTSLNSNLDSLKNQFTPKLIKSPKNSLRAIINRTSIPFNSKTSKITVNKLMKLERRSCKKSPSNYELGGETNRFFKDNNISSIIENVEEETNQSNSKKHGEIDPIYYEEFIKWKRNPVLDKKSSEFMQRLYDEEIYPAFNFKNIKLADEVLEAIKTNNIIIELNTDRSQVIPKKCALLEIPRTCNHRIKINEEWYNISQICRDRTSAVCDLFCYLRYIQQGLVKSGLIEVYWEIARRRKNAALSRLGFSAL